MARFISSWLLAPPLTTSEVVKQRNARALISSEFTKFKEASQQGNLVPLFRRILSDQLTLALAYRCLVKEDDWKTPSFLLESVENNETGTNMRPLVFRPNLSPGSVDLSIGKYGSGIKHSNMTKCEYKAAVHKAKDHILAGDIFQVVISQRFERRTHADPFEVYRALRVVNPSPYMIYLQARGCILVASSPEILTQVNKGKIISRPLAGTRRRGRSREEDLLLEKELLEDEKECAEHVMLVDLGRNDVGKVAKVGSVRVEKLMGIERYSHVMHMSSTVSGEMRDDVTSWDVLRAALPAGTVTGAPKKRSTLKKMYQKCCTHAMSKAHWTLQK